MRTSYLDYMRRMLDGGGRHLDMLITPLNQAEARAIRKLHRLPEMVNEANLTASDNVGGSTASPDACDQCACSSSNTSAAPEVAASDDDGDGDGDGDPDSDRRRPGRPCNTRNTLPSTVEHFDRLPDSACIDIAALKAITGKSRATLYRWIDKGILPKPRKLGLTSNNVWAAGDIRRALSA